MWPPISGNSFLSRFGIDSTKNMHIRRNYRLSELHLDCFFYDRFHVCAIHLVHSHFYDAPQIFNRNNIRCFSRTFKHFFTLWNFFCNFFGQMSRCQFMFKNIVAFKISRAISSISFFQDGENLSFFRWATFYEKVRMLLQTKTHYRKCLANA